jgi:sterol 14-demethylase
MVAANATFSPLVELLSRPSQWSTNPPILSIAAGLLFVLISAFALRPTKSDKIRDLRGIPVVTAWGFFTKRFDFIQRHLKKSGGKMFRFRVLQASSKFTKILISFTTANLLSFQHRVIAVTGEQARKVFYNDQSLDLTEGYKILMGGAPSNEDIQSDTQLRSFVNRVLLMLRKDRIADSPYHLSL